MSTRSSQKKWVISDGEDEDEEVGLDVRELFALSKKKAASEPQVNDSEDTEADKFYTPNEEFGMSRASSQLTISESNTEKYFTADDDNTPNTRLEDSAYAESVSDKEEDPEADIRPKVSQTRRSVINDNEDESSNGIAINEKEASVVNNGSESFNARENSDKEAEETVSNNDEDSEGNIRPKVGRARCAVIDDDEDEDSDVIVINDKEHNVASDGSESSNAQENLISDEEEEEEKRDKEISKECDEPVPKKSKIVKPFSTQGFQNGAKKKWWEEFLEPVPDNQKCQVDKCTFASKPHKKHDLNIRSYSEYETRLIIQYLIYYNLIEYGKGIQVWKDLHALGYLKHRSIESLNNHFKRYLLRDIKSYKLPKDIENEFLKLRTSRKGY